MSVRRLTNLVASAKSTELLAATAQREFDNIYKNLQQIALSAVDPVVVTGSQVSIKTASRTQAGALSAADYARFDDATSAIYSSGNVTADERTKWNSAYTHSLDVSGGVHGATSSNTANMIVRRGASGEIETGAITSHSTIHADSWIETAGTLWAVGGQFSGDVKVSGNLGIGKDPTCALDVLGEARLISSTDTNVFVIDRASGGPYVQGFDILKIYTRSNQTGPMARGDEIALENVDATSGNYTGISNYRADGQINAEIQFVNVSHSTYESRIRFNLRIADGSYGTRFAIDGDGTMWGVSSLNLTCTDPSSYGHNLLVLSNNAGDTTHPGGVAFALYSGSFGGFFQAYHRSDNDTAGIAQFTTYSYNSEVNISAQQAFMHCWSGTAAQSGNDGKIAFGGYGYYANYTFHGHAYWEDYSNGAIFRIVDHSNNLLFSVRNVSGNIGVGIKGDPGSGEDFTFHGNGGTLMADGGWFYIRSAGGANFYFQTADYSGLNIRVYANSQVAYTVSKAYFAQFSTLNADEVHATSIMLDPNTTQGYAYMGFKVWNVDVMTLRDTGRVGIMKTNPSCALDVVGEVLITNNSQPVYVTQWGIGIGATPAAGYELDIHPMGVGQTHGDLIVRGGTTGIFEINQVNDNNTILHSNGVLDIQSGGEIRFNYNNSVTGEFRWYAGTTDPWLRAGFAAGLGSDLAVYNIDRTGIVISGLYKRIYMPDGSQYGSGYLMQTTASAGFEVQVNGGKFWIGRYSDNAEMFAVDDADGDTRVKGTLTLKDSTFSETYSSQTTGWRISHAGEADFRYIYTDELHTKAFIADLEQALAGSQIICKSVAKLAAAVEDQATEIDVEEFAGFPGFRVFVDGDMIRVRQFTRAAGQLTIYNAWAYVTFKEQIASNPPGQRYYLWQNTGHTIPGWHDVTQGFYVKEGGLVLDYGVEGTNGFMETNAADGLNGVNSPYVQAVLFNADGDYTVKARLGNLLGHTDADFGALSGFGLYTQHGFFKGNIFVKSATSMALPANTIALGNITGVAGNSIKIANTGSGNTANDGFFAYNGSSAVVFALRMNNTAQIAGWSFDALKLFNGTDIVLDASGKKVSVAADAVQMYYTDPMHYGLKDSAGMFSLGYENFIAGWTFDTGKLYNGTDVVLSATGKKVSVAADAVKLYFTDATHYGIMDAAGKFSLGYDNFIAGWTFTTTTLYKELDNATSLRAVVLDAAIPQIVVRSHEYDLGRGGMGIWIGRSPLGVSEYGIWGQPIDYSGVPDGNPWFYVKTTYDGLTKSALIAGWTFDGTHLYNGTNIVLDASSATKKMSVSADAVMMYYTSGADYGIKDSGLKFQLGSTNQIAGWSFTTTVLNRVLADFDGNGMTAELQLNAGIQQIVAKMYDPMAGATGSYVSMGVDPVSGTDYGFWAGKTDTDGNPDVAYFYFRVPSAGGAPSAKIAGWSFSDLVINSIYGNNIIEMYSQANGGNQTLRVYNSSSKVMVSMGMGYWSNNWQNEIGFALIENWANTPYVQFTKNVTTGTLTAKIAGWTFDSAKIYQTNAVLASAGYVSFGATPPTGYGNNVGAWLGYSSGAKMSLYSDANNYMQWDGSALSVGGATLTAGTVRTSGANTTRVELNGSANAVKFVHATAGADDIAVSMTTSGYLTFAVANMVNLKTTLGSGAAGLGIGDFSSQYPASAARLVLAQDHFDLHRVNSGGSGYDYQWYAPTQYASPGYGFILAQKLTLGDNINDDTAAGIVLSPSYYAALSYGVTRHSYITLDNPALSGGAGVTDACVFRFTAAVGTHKAVDSGSTHPHPATTDAWIKININGTVYYMPAYTHKT